MTCEDSRAYLSAYLDDELDVTGNLQVQTHLARCPECRRAREEQLALRSSLRELYAKPSEDLAKRVEAAVQQAARKEDRLEFLRWAPAVAPVVLVTAIGAWFAIHNLRSSHQQEISSAVLASHVRSLQAGHLVDVPSPDQHTVKPWFQGKLDFSPPAPDLSGQGWTLIGGRLDYVDGQPVAALVYQRGKHYINVFLWPNRGTADDAIQHEEAQGYQILHWNGSAMNYWIVSDLNQVELRELAKALRSR